MTGSSGHPVNASCAMTRGRSLLGHPLSRMMTTERGEKMPKGYWIAHIDVSNPEAYKDYVTANAVPLKKYGAKFLVRGGKFENPEGKVRSRNVVLEFKDYETALACYNSPEYQAAIKLRTPHSAGDVIVIEGYDGPQP